MPRRTAMIAMILAACGLFATEPAAPAGRTTVNPISEALCGRPSSEEARATALDKLDLSALPAAWRNANVEELEPWLAAPRCADGTDVEYSLFMRRRATLRALCVRIDRAIEVGRFEDALNEFPRWSQKEDEWPAAAECSGCDALRRAAAAGMKIVSDWPRRKAKTRSLAAWLDGEEHRESLIRELCRAMPEPQAREEMESRFRYYTWTARGATLVEIAQWFERPDVLAECRGPH